MEPTIYEQGVIKTNTGALLQNKLNNTVKTTIVKIVQERQTQKRMIQQQLLRQMKSGGLPKPFPSKKEPRRDTEASSKTKRVIRQQPRGEYTQLVAQVDIVQSLHPKFVLGMVNQGILLRNTTDRDRRVDRFLPKTSDQHAILTYTC